MTLFSLQKRGFRFSFFTRLLRRAVLDQPTVDSGGVSRGKCVAVAVGCWLCALQRHSNGTSTALLRHFTGTQKNVALLLSALVQRFSVSRMRDFYCGLPITAKYLKITGDIMQNYANACKRITIPEQNDNFA